MIDSRASTTRIMGRPMARHRYWRSMMPRPWKQTTVRYGGLAYRFWVWRSASPWKRLLLWWSGEDPRGELPRI